MAVDAPTRSSRNARQARKLVRAVSHEITALLAHPWPHSAPFIDEIRRLVRVMTEVDARRNRDQSVEKAREALLPVVDMVGRGRKAAEEKAPDLVQPFAIAHARLERLLLPEAS